MSEDCPHCVFEKTEANCRGCFEGSHYKPKPVTNYGRLVSKSPEEMVEWIESIEPAACPWRDDYGDNCRFTHCRDCWLDWLRQEATNDP